MQNSQNKLIIIIGTLLITLGMIILTSNYFNEKVDNAYTYMNNLLLENNETEILELQEEVASNDETTSSLENMQIEETVTDPYAKYYIGTLEIPKINLNKGFTAIDSPYNTVNKNI